MHATRHGTKVGMHRTRLGQGGPRNSNFSPSPSPLYVRQVLPLGLGVQVGLTEQRSA